MSGHAEETQTGAEDEAAHRVDVTYEDRTWALRFPDLNCQLEHVAAPKRVRRFAYIEQEARKHIAAVIDVAPNTVTLDLNITVDGVDVTQSREQVQALKVEATRAEHAALTEQRQLALSMHERGVPTRDIGSMLGVSQQLAQTLVVR